VNRGCSLLPVSWLALLLLTGACNLQMGTPTPLPTPDAPRIEFQEPANNSRVVEGAEIEFLILAQDAGEGIARVELLVDDQHIDDGVPEVSPAVPVFSVRMNWKAEGIGFHSVTAIAYRPDGIGSRPVTINVLVTSPDDV
jgi:hypothetical protein